MGSNRILERMANSARYAECRTADEERGPQAPFLFILVLCQKHACGLARPVYFTPCINLLINGASRNNSTPEPSSAQNPKV